MARLSGIIAAGFAAAVLITGCAGTPQDAKSPSTAAQVASAVAKTEPKLSASMKFFAPGLCPTVIDKKLGGEIARTCQRELKRLRHLARRMKADLEATRPWSAEISELATNTASDLDRLALATEETDSKGVKVAVFTASVRVQLRAWKPYLGDDQRRRQGTHP